MKERTIIFPLDDADRIGEKIERIKRLIGEENVNTDGIDLSVPMIRICCCKELWKEIQFICNLEKCYW